MSAFTSTLKSFCEELRLTFPELEPQIARATATASAQFWKSWSTGLTILMRRDVQTLFSERKGFLIGAVRLTPELWSELSEKTQVAIWKYLRTLTLEAAMEVSLESLDTETMQKLMDILTAERVEADPAAATSELFEESMNHMKPLMEKLKGLMGSTGFMDLSGLGDFQMPDIPERLRNGRIAKLAEEMAKQFDPQEFGIDPALLNGDNVEEILKRLADLYQRDPTLLIGGAKRMAERIKKQILGGSLNRDELVGEAQEFIALFKEHPMFKDIMGKVSGFMGADGLASMFGSGGSDSGGAPSERRRAVQERLRKKMASRSGSGSK
jgi:hypothetical protein